uniref:protein-disulfide reductase DsbD family protein n=1 Tax=Zhouia sp. PK063 TaxID=3373602 RepID=UPI0037DC3D75
MKTKQFISRLPLVWILLICLYSVKTTAQIYKPVTWHTAVEKIDEHNYKLLINAEIENGWHLYGQHIAKGGPEATVITFDKSESYELTSVVEASKPITIYDEVFEMQTSFFEKKATFSQIITIKNKAFDEINGGVYFMVCNDQQCLPPETISLNFKMPWSKTSFITSGNQKVTSATTQNKTTLTNSKTDTKEREPATKSYGGIFLLAFLSGFAALLTPCVFPMIPLTVSFFTKQATNKAVGIRKALLYGISIVIIYVFLGTIVTLIFGANALNALATNVWFNLLFFIILVIFAVSFLGAFEIVLPSSWGTRMDARADKGGMIGIFFMALALAIVSFSCTGPIVGTILVQAASSGGLAPLLGMLGFSLAIAIPFTLFAIFPGWLQSLPKSGGWLNTVKGVLGLLELALAFKFLSNADLVLQLHLLERETFLTIWIAIFMVLTLYLFGKIKLPHDSPITNISVGRVLLGTGVLAFTLYLIPGLFGAPLKWVSGFPPPQYYSESPGIYGNNNVTQFSGELPQGAEKSPQGITVFKDYDAGLAYAKKVNKPVLLDFTGYACVNCRKMEEHVWSTTQVLSLLQDDLVLISLYIDDKRELPKEEQHVSEYTGKKIKTTGDKWSDFQIHAYNTNAQPYYVVINPKGEQMNDPVGYTSNTDDYAKWLTTGIQNYIKNK